MAPSLTCHICGCAINPSDTRYFLVDINARGYRSYGDPPPTNIYRCQDCHIKTYPTHPAHPAREPKDAVPARQS